ncbi:MAG: hypothetical protein KGL39_01595 [Patescibacteria group bacterium]|nr:hypothetical protein [Patescibacteria group bacterium]
MFGGKTTALLAWVERKRYACLDAVLIVWADDNRYTDDGVAKTCTHSLQVATPEKRTATKGGLRIVRAKSLAGLDIDEGVVAVDEGQFHPDISVVCEAWAAAGKRVAVAALDMRFDRSPFENVALLMAIADGSVVKFRPVCMRCRQRDAVYSCRTVADESPILVGAADAYIATCRGCWTPAPKKG